MKFIAETNGLHNEVNEVSRFKERIDLESSWRSEQIHVNGDIDYSSEVKEPVDREPVG